jgi:signal transduction histidine kinase
MSRIYGNLQARSAGRRDRHSVFDSFRHGHNGTSTSLEILRADSGTWLCPRTNADVAAAIVHEISQSLTAIVANAQAAGLYLSAERADLEALRATIQSILRDSIETAQTIRNIGTVFRGADTDDAPVNLLSIIKDVLVRLDPKIHQYSINTRLSVDSGGGPVAGNRLQLGQVLTNLITNAVESREQNCEWPRDLEIKVSGEGKTVRTESADRGHRAIDLEKIFDAFFSTKYAGMGMGLRICRTIIEAHKGRLWASARFDRGTILTFTLPLARGLA